MKEYIDKPFYDVDYCKYSDWGYKKELESGQTYWDLHQKLVKRIAPTWKEQNTNSISAISVSSKMVIKSFHYHRKHFVKNTKTMKNSEEEGYH